MLKYLSYSQLVGIVVKHIAIDKGGLGFHSLAS